MERSDQTYLELIRNYCTRSEEKVEIPEAEWEKLQHYAGKHFMAAAFTPYLKADTHESNMVLKKQLKMLLYNYYQIEHFTRMIVSLLDRNGISCYLLKGISLAAYYPEAEYRKLGDVDLYINEEKALERAKEVLVAEGFVEEKEISDHHLTYHYTFAQTGRTYLLELHYHVVGMYQYEPANQVINEVFSSGNLRGECQVIEGYEYQVLPPTEYVFYMLHHMLKHYLYSGFGIRLLCDFICYVEARCDEIDFDRLHAWCRKSHMMHFYETIMESCHRYLGLGCEIDGSIRGDQEVSRKFIEKILVDKDVGSGDSRTLVGSGTYEKVHLGTYFREGHLQMKVRFKKLGRCPLLWPILWVITFVCFVRNTYKLRNTTVRETLQAFRKKNDELQLIPIFEQEKNKTEKN